MSVIPQLKKEREKERKGGEREGRPRTFSEKREFLMVMFVEDNDEHASWKMRVDFKFILLGYMTITSHSPLFSDSSLFFVVFLQGIVT